MTTEKLIFEISLSPDQIRQASELLSGLGAVPDDAQESPSMKLVDILARELKVWPESWGIFCVATKVESNDAAWFNFRNPVFKDGGWQDLGSVELWLSQEPEDRKEVVVRRFEWQAAVDALKVAEGIADAEAGNLTPMGEVKNKWELRRNARTLGGLIELGYLQPIHLETPSYDFSAWPTGVLPMKYPQFVGQIKRKIVIDPKPDPVSLAAWDGEGLPNAGTKCVIKKGEWSIRETAEQLIGPVVTVSARFKTLTGIEMVAVDGGSALGCEVFRADMCFHLPTKEEIAKREREDTIEAMVAVSPLLDKGWSHKVCAALYDGGYRKP